MLFVALLALTVMPLASTSWLTDCTGGCTGGGNGELICGSRPNSGLSGAPVPDGTTLGLAGTPGTSGVAGTCTPSGGIPRMPCRVRATSTGSA